MARRKRPSAPEPMPAEDIIYDLTDPVYRNHPPDVARHFGCRASLGGSDPWAHRLDGWLRLWEATSTGYQGETASGELPPDTLENYGHGPRCACLEWDI
jgi:hypothetical protein